MLHEWAADLMRIAKELQSGPLMVVASIIVIGNATYRLVAGVAKWFRREPKQETDNNFPEGA